MRSAPKSTIGKTFRLSEFWTPEGFDALKRGVGDIRDATQYRNFMRSRPY
jgi:hypothetical protein